MPGSTTPHAEALLAPHLRSLLRVAYRLVRNSSDAKDLVQDTCIAACEHLPALQAADHPLRWLLAVMHNRFIDGTRQHRRRPQVTLEEADASSPLICEEPGPEDALLRSDAERRLEQAYLQLEDMQRTLLVLRAEGYDLTEIQAITGVHKDVLRARLHRARRSLARHLEGQGAAPLSSPRLRSVT